MDSGFEANILKNQMERNIWINPIRLNIKNGRESMPKTGCFKIEFALKRMICYFEARFIGMINLIDQ